MNAWFRLEPNMCAQIDIANNTTPTACNVHNVYISWLKISSSVNEDLLR